MHGFTGTKQLGTPSLEAFAH